MREDMMPKRWSVGNYDGYMVERDGGDYVEAEDVEPLVEEITRLRSRVEVLEKHLALMITNTLTGSFESEGLATDRAIAVLPDWLEKATGYTRAELDAAAARVNLHVEEAKP